jgi:hypothetical protein
LKTINSFKQIQGLHFDGNIKAPLTSPEIFLHLAREKKSEEIKVLSRLVDYLDRCYLKRTPNSIEYNKLLVDIFLLFEKNFDMKNNLQKSFYILILHLTERADRMHKELRSKDMDLYLISPSMHEFMRCYYNMHMGKYVYYDKNIFVGFRPCLRNKPDELFVFVRKNNHFTFNSIENAQSKLSISSLKKAKKAIKEWKGEMKLGFSHTLSSMKLCELLGLDVDRVNGEVRLYRQKGVGF